MAKKFAECVSHINTVHQSGTIETLDYETSAIARKFYIFIILYQRV